MSDRGIERTALQLEHYGAMGRMRCDGWMHDAVELFRPHKDASHKSVASLHFPILNCRNPSTLSFTVFAHYSYGIPGLLLLLLEVLLALSISSIRSSNDR